MRENKGPGESGMKRIDQICGLAVIDAGSGARIGDVVQVILRPDSRTIAGIDISSRSGGQRFIDFGDIQIFGDVSVLVKRDETGRKKKPKERLEFGQKVYSTDGSDMGWFTNALIDEASGEIHSLEVSEGYIDDLAKGRAWVREFSCGEKGITALQNGRIH